MANSKGNRQEKINPANEMSKKGNGFDLFPNLLIFRLSERLGGRSEVLNTPVSEALFHFENQGLVEKEERIKEFLNMYYSNPESDKHGRKRHIESLKPVVAEDANYETNIDYLKQLKAQQEKGGITF